MVEHDPETMKSAEPLSNSAPKRGRAVEGVREGEFSATFAAEGHLTVDGSESPLESFSKFRQGKRLGVGWIEFPRANARNLKNIDVR